MSRPTKYSKAVLTKIKNLPVEVTTNDQIATVLGVNVDTVYEWKKVHPEFSEILKKHQDRADDAVENALLTRALGCSVKQTKTTADLDASGKPIKQHVEETIQEKPPDTAAGFIWLKNRRGWKNDPEVKQEGQGAAKIIRTPLPGPAPKKPKPRPKPKGKK